MDDSSFGRLPAELRNSVYELVLTHPTPFNLEPRLDPKAGSKTRAVAASEPNFLALVKTCKQINTECSQIVYSSNIFSFTNWAYSPDYTHLLATFTSQIGSLKADAIRTVFVNIGLASDSDGDEGTRKMMTTVANIKCRQKSLPACTFELQFYVYGDEVESVLKLALCLKDGDTLESSRVRCMEKIEVLAQRMKRSNNRWRRRTACSTVKEYGAMLDKVFARFNRVG